MSAKRPAQHDIDEKTLEDKQPQRPQTQQNETNKQSDQSKERTILAVKKDQDKSQLPVQDKTVQQKQQSLNPKPAANNLFSNLFASNSSSNGNGLFSNTGSSLFANNTGSGLFGNSKPTTGLFASSKQTQDKKNKAGGLFATTTGTSSGSSIFNFQAGGVPPVKNGGSSLFSGNTPGQNAGQDSGDSAQLEAAQNLQADPTKSTASYKYEQTCKVILKQKAFKFKKQGGDLIQNVEVVFTQDLTSKIYFVSILLPATKKSIYSGMIVPEKSQVKHMNNKKENVEISAFSVNAKTKKLESSALKLQFEKPQTGTEVFETAQKIVSGTYASNEENNVTQTEDKKQAKKQDSKQVETTKDSIKQGAADPVVKTD